ncbi:peptidyl-prolyl cis-trans isomerase A (rotamase A) [anaerobic digester metagenome]|uniref:peptidylprolyl isomerase n=1 Tax=anaerobic digester metagenome TaxID=1263854 RepID=A0A485LUW2_9ZZZZ
MKKMTIFSSILLFGLISPAAADSGKPVVRLETTKGNIVLELDREKAPKTVDNFLSLVESGFYEGTIFHRVIKGFMIQGGGLTENMTQKPTGVPIPNEADNSLKNVRGSIAMARTQDPHSATSQFFINTVDNAFLNHSSKTLSGWGYCVFGRVVEGMDVVDAIESSPTTTYGMYTDVPSEPIVINKASVVTTAP